MILHFEGDQKRKSKIEVTKEGRKWLYFTALSNHCKYRMNKETGEVQVAPYWNKTKCKVSMELI